MIKNILDLENTFLNHKMYDLKEHHYSQSLQSIVLKLNSLIISNIEFQIAHLHLFQLFQHIREYI